MNNSFEYFVFIYCDFFCISNSIHLEMQTTALVILTIVGGILTLFGVAGYSSYKHNKLPEKPTLFRWFVAGLIGAGAASYAWLFGANGNPSEVINHVSEMLEVTDYNIVDAVSKATENISSRPRTQSMSEINVGMPNF